MNVNGITNTASVNSYMKTEKANAKQEEKAVGKEANEGVTHEKGDVKAYKQDPELIAKLKADNEQRVAQMQKLVNDMLSKQGKTFDIANGTNLKGLFENLEVDVETVKKAQEDVSEDGYWGVKQTSERMFEFAKALSGGDPEKMQKMREAFEKGYKQAEKAWGSELPEISQKTYEATQKLFDDYANQLNS